MGVFKGEKGVDVKGGPKLWSVRREINATPCETRYRKALADPERLEKRNIVSLALLGDREAELMERSKVVYNLTAGVDRYLVV